MRESRELHVLEGEEATRFLSEPAIRSGWEELTRDCPWATVCQEPAFVHTYYDVYEAVRPLVVARTENGRLTGLATLARLPGGEVVFAGGHQAEYHAWLEREEDGFVEELLGALSGRGVATLTFRYLPPDAPVAWLERGRWASRAFATRMRKPIMDVTDTSHVEASLKKKANRSRLNRLGRVGPVEVVPIETVDDANAILDELIAFTDLRQGAANGVRPFATDRHKRDFFVRLLDEGVLHWTLLRAGEELAAAHIGFRNRDEVILGIISHSPFLAAHSPGKFLIYLLAEGLRDEGFRAVDLSPGGDPYKARFATGEDFVYRVYVELSTSRYLRQRARSALVAVARWGLGVMRIDPDAVKRRRSRSPGERLEATVLRAPSPASFEAAERLEANAVDQVLLLLGANRDALRRAEAWFGAGAESRSAATPEAGGFLAWVGSRGPRWSDDVPDPPAELEGDATWVWVDQGSARAPDTLEASLLEIVAGVGPEEPAARVVVFGLTRDEERRLRSAGFEPLATLDVRCEPLPVVSAVRLRES